MTSHSATWIRTRAHRRRGLTVLTAMATAAATVVAAVVFLVSLLGPLAAVSPAATAVLLCMHSIVAGILIFGLGAPRRCRTAAPGEPSAPVTRPG